MNKKVFFIFALLCAVVHGAWAKTEAFNPGVSSGISSGSQSFPAD